MLQGLDEKRMARRRSVKVRPNPGATVRDMKDHLNALLRKKPDHLILHVHANDASNENVTSDMIFDRLMDLKDYAESKVPGMGVAISCPVVRRDNSLANVKQVQLKNRLKRSGTTIIDNDNITYDHLGKKGLHLNNRGTGKLAMNMIAFIRGL